LESLDFLAFLDFFFLLLAWALHWVVIGLSPNTCGGRAPPMTIAATRIQILTTCFIVLLFLLMAVTGVTAYFNTDKKRR